MPLPRHPRRLVDSPVRRIPAAAFAALLPLALALPSRAAVVAVAQSPAGLFPSFRVELDTLAQPSAVASFMGLADGSQPWVDPLTGRLRGGPGDAFYAGMVFDWHGGDAIQGGLKGITDEDGNTRYTGGPGYTVRGKAKGAWQDVPAGALVLAEDNGPHSGNAGVALFLTNGVSPWTVFGQVVPGDEPAARALADRVAQGATEVAWSVDDSEATPAELEALSRARAALPAPGWLSAKVADGGKKFAFDWPPHSCLGILAADDLTAKSPEYVAGGWTGSDETLSLAFDWEEIGLTNGIGFVALTDVAYPAWSGRLFSGKWRMGMDHTGQRLQYWFDFDAQTGMVAVVESGEITERAAFTQLQCWRETGNGVVVYYGRGLVGNYYFLGFAEDGAATGRFMSRQISALGAVNTDWGEFEMAEGWEDAAPSPKSLRRPAPLAPGTARWVPWSAPTGRWNPNAIPLPAGPPDAAPVRPATLPHPPIGLLPVAFPP